MTKTAAAATDAVRDLALVFSGGVGLGGYQGGVYAYLHQQPRLRPSWIAGSSIGAVNAALIAGNPPADRIDRLRMFWMNAAPVPTYRTGRLRHWQNWTSVLQGRLFGIPGHFHPRWLAPASGFKSFYSLRPMQARICELVDFGRLNSGEIRVSVATTDIETGEMVVFDTGRGARIEVAHLLASCGYLPEFAPVAIDGRLLGDGGLSANAPIEAVLGAEASPALIFVVDLFARDGHRPTDLESALARKNDLIFANQTHQRLEAFRRECALRPQPLSDSACRRIIHLSYRAPPEEAGPERPFDYSRHTMEERWHAGALDCEEACRVLAQPLSEPVTSIRREPPERSDRP